MSREQIRGAPLKIAAVDVNHNRVILGQSRGSLQFKIIDKNWFYFCRIFSAHSWGVDIQVETVFIHIPNAFRGTCVFHRLRASGAKVNRLQ